jgi:ubiquinone/menaquinone biosynthesis C-methylase UbiE
LDDRPYINLKGVQYLFPVDEAEMDRNDRLFHMLKQAFADKIFFSPVEISLEQGCKVLDIGCGKGNWVMEMAAKYPESKFVGVDLYPFATTTEMPNCNFEIVNVTSGIPFSDNTFDYIVIQSMETSFTKGQWADLLRECYRILQPGGYIELKAFEGNLHRASPVSKAFIDRISFACGIREIDSRIAGKFTRYLQMVGYSCIESSFHSMPIYWGGQIGQSFGDILTEAYDILEPSMSMPMNISKEEYLALTKEIARDCGEYKSFYNYFISYGMKPFQ